MIGTEFYKGAGLGNQLFCYVAMRALAEDKGYSYGIITPQYLANNIHCDKGMYFLEIDLGKEILEEQKKEFNLFCEKDSRLYLCNSKHDIENGVYVSGADANFFNVSDNTLLYGNLQDESYFIKYKDELKDWLKLKPEYDSYLYCKDNLCVIHMRCGDYTGSLELWLGRKYWTNGIKNMKRFREDMEFLIVTDDVMTANRILPGIKAVSNDIGTDYAILKNAKYLLLSNSSFAVFPAYTSDVLIIAIAPKYWARHNVSDGYWASEQNIYSIFTYQDKKGKLFSAEECKMELARYKLKSKKYKKIDKKPSRVYKKMQYILRFFKYKLMWVTR